VCYWIHFIDLNQVPNSSRFGRRDWD
jgi:hypothetical protein